MIFCGVLGALVVLAAPSDGSGDAIDCGPNMVSCPGLADCVPTDKCSEDRADAGKSSIWLTGRCVEDDPSRLLNGDQADFLFLMVKMFVGITAGAAATNILACSF